MIDAVPSPCSLFLSLLSSPPSLFLLDSNAMEQLWQDIILNNFNDYMIIAVGTFICRSCYFWFASYQLMRLHVGHEFTWLFLNGIYMVIDCYGLFPQYRIHKVHTYASFGANCVFRTNLQTCRSCGRTSMHR